jgi:hypothetical protein
MVFVVPLLLGMCLLSLIFLFSFNRMIVNFYCEFEYAKKSAEHLRYVSSFLTLSHYFYDVEIM